MRHKPILLRQVAEQDISNAINWYATSANREVTSRYIDALQEAYLVITTNPKIGSKRYSDLLEIPNLRSLALKKFPFHIFYVEHEEHIEIWRVLNTNRDIFNAF